MDLTDYVSATVTGQAPTAASGRWAVVANPPPRGLADWGPPVPSPATEERPSLAAWLAADGFAPVTRWPTSDTDPSLAVWPAPAPPPALDGATAADGAEWTAAPEPLLWAEEAWTWGPQSKGRRWLISLLIAAIIVTIVVAVVSAALW